MSPPVAASGQHEMLQVEIHPLENQKSDEEQKLMKQDDKRINVLVLH